MSVIRVYLPGRADDLVMLADARQVEVTGRRAYAVTAELIAATPRADLDEREHAAFSEAAVMAVDLAGPDRAVILAADVPEVETRQCGGLTVELSGALELRQVASFHVAERAGDPDADLLWYDATEVAAVKALVTAPPH